MLHFYIAKKNVLSYEWKCKNENENKKKIAHNENLFSMFNAYNSHPFT